LAGVTLIDSKLGVVVVVVPVVVVALSLLPPPHALKQILSMNPIVLISVGVKALSFIVVFDSK
jgi:hypothetical protein